MTLWGWLLKHLLTIQAFTVHRKHLYCHNHTIYRDFTRSRMISRMIDRDFSKILEFIP
jgi:hypothetical protein